MAGHIPKEGESFLGFSVLSRKDLPEYRSTGIKLVHEVTGAEVYHLHNDDKENLFSYIFRTPPDDHTGVAHIIEHSVLCGSKHFPLKDPFVSLLKGSMQTFLNAMTFPDKTVYPASSMIEKDFFNLMLVYGDAVFFPLLKEEVFHQEGHHVEFMNEKDTASALKLVGVVYNEMKGNYSSPEYIVADYSFRSLFPDSPYGFDSGGNPTEIPALTYDNFIQFHRKFYHPSNCKLFLYGNIPTVTHLAFLQEKFLSKFSKAPVHSEIPLQPRWNAPTRKEIGYPVNESDPVNKKSAVTMNWLTVPIADPFKVIALEVLSEVLLGNAGSPLRKALIDSHLGEDLTPASGLETELNEVVFTVGLRGTDIHRVDSIETIVLETLRRLVTEGIGEDLLKASLQRVEFRNREIKGDAGPYSLKLMRRLLRGWLHGTDPETTLEFNHWIKEFKNKIKKGTISLSALIEENLLNNPHRSTLIVRPDHGLTKKTEMITNQSLSESRRGPTARDRQKIVNSIERLRTFQEKPDPPELLKRIPCLTIRDLPGTVECIPSEEIALESGVPLLFHDIFTNGVIYIDLAFDTSNIPDDASILLPLFGKGVCGLGLPDKPYDEVAKMLSQYTGGFASSLSASSALDNSQNTQEHLFFRLKILKEHAEPALKLITRLLLEANFDDQLRLKDLFLELRNGCNASVIPNGHQFVSLRAGSRLSNALLREETWKGISQVLWLSQVSSGLSTSLPEISSSLQRIRTPLLSRKYLTVNVTTERDIFKEVCGPLSDALTFLPEGKPEKGDDAAEKSRQTAIGSPLQGKAEAFIIPSHVGYVAKAVRGARLGTQRNAYETVLSHLLRTGYLWEKVRMRGGAYGAFAVPYGTEGVFIFSSYRDPNIIETLNAFEDSLKQVVNGAVDRDQIAKAVIGVVGREEKPLDPRDKGFVSLQRHLWGITDELRQQRRETVLSANKKSLTSAAEQLLSEYKQGCAAVLSNKDAIETAGQTNKDLQVHRQTIPL